MHTSPRVKMAMIGTSVCALIIALVPFHAFLTVWASTFVGHYTLLRLWKEFLIILLFPGVAYLLHKHRGLWHEAKRAWLFKLFLLYIGLHLLLGVISLDRHQVDLKALGYALIVNLRLMVFFFETWVITSCRPWLRNHARNLLLIPAAIVVVFGLLQAFVLPTDFLAHFGYGPHTIAPYQTVNDNLQYVRVQSTLRGSDPLGAYLVVVISMLASIVAARRAKGNWRYVVWAGLLASLAVLFFTYSRGAYIGAVLALIAIGWYGLRSRRARQTYIAVGVAICLIGGVSVLALRHNARFENTFLHTSQQSKIPTSSNQKHVSASKQGLHDVIHQPLGLGPGTAGPASVYNNHPARVPEDYYLQLGEEVGWLGLFLFIMIIVLLARQLWERREDWLAMALLASLIGISFIGFLTQVWTDDTLSLVWWGTAAAVLAVSADQLDAAFAKQKAHAQLDGTKKPQARKHDV